MKQLIALSLLGLTLAGSASALSNTGSVWSGRGCQTSTSEDPGFRYCTAAISSATTVAQLGKVYVAPNKVINVVLGISGTAVNHLVTPTLSFYLGSKVVATQDVSVSSAGNIVFPSMGNSLGVPLYDAISVSVSTPSTVSQTNGITMGITENDK